MSDRVLISVEHYKDLAGHLPVAKQYGLGLELQEFADPNVLDGDWRGLLKQYQAALVGFEGMLTLHGCYIDLVSGSPDKKLVALTRERYQHNIDIGRMLGATAIDFHANYLPLVDQPSYLSGWIDRQVDFWSALSEQAGQQGIMLLLENMWEPNPDIIERILARIQSPHLKACLDVGHAYLYSGMPLDAWIKTLGADLVYMHLHNNNGHHDAHLAFNEGGMDFPPLLDKLRNMPVPPIFTLEMPDLPTIQASLPYLNLDRYGG
jgi:sugar phosphate isomerase/epimerase